jgi:hypothetical protein
VLHLRVFCHSNCPATATPKNKSKKMKNRVPLLCPEDCDFKTKSRSCVLRLWPSLQQEPKYGDCQFSYHQKFDDFAQRNAGLSFAFHDIKTGFYSPKNLHMATGGRYAVFYIMPE